MDITASNQQPRAIEHKVATNNEDQTLLSSLIANHIQHDRHDAHRYHCQSSSSWQDARLNRQLIQILDQNLFDRDLEASSFELLNSSLGIVFRDSFSDRLREPRDKFFGFLKTNARNTTDGFECSDTL